MEKIYENNSKKNKRSKKMKLNGSTCLTFSIALIAVFALMAVGVTGISYAFPQPEDYNDAESFTATESSLLFYSGDDDTLNYTYATVGGVNKPVFCIERMVNFTNGSTYNRESELTDKGLYYILSYVNTTDSDWDFSNIEIVKTGSGEDFTDDDVKYWFGQAAIFYYLRQTGAAGNDPASVAGGGGFDSNNLATYTKVTTNDFGSVDLEDTNISSSKHFASKTASTPLFDAVKVEGKTITQLVNEAKEKKNSSESLAEVTITAKDDVIQTDSEKKFYFSPEYTLNVVTTGTYVKDINSLKVTLGGAPDGTKLVDKDGVELDPSNMSTSKTFYVRVPADKVTKDTKITIDVEANVNATSGYKYIVTGDATKQALAILGSKEKVLNTSTTLSLTPAGDTGMNVGQTVYFIGLIVLLCGVGIIYANAKPSQVKE